MARAGMGTDGVYYLLGVAGITQWRPGVPLPDPGDDVGYAFETFDGKEWSPILRGTLTIGAGHTLEPGDVTASTTGGPASLVAAHHAGTLYLAGLGGLQLLGGAGTAESYTSDDGLASDTTQHVATGPNGAVWIATDAGISVLVPED
jgi:hypothetical protein